MRLPIRPIRGRWPAAIARFKPLRRYFRIDPRVLLDDDADPAAFREAMSSVYVGGTIKITGSGRHPATDRLLLEHVDLSDATIVDIGASDGSTSIDLIRQLPDFRQYVIADLYLWLEAAAAGQRTVFFDGDGTAVLISGPRFAAWPSLSRLVAWAYAGVIRRAASSQTGRRPVLLLNPDVRRLLAHDERLQVKVHDVFQPWTGETADVIKVANLLRRLYFDDQDLVRALEVLRASLPDGGHLLIVDNPRLRRTPPRAGLWRKEGGQLIEVARTGEPEIADLIPVLNATVPLRSGPSARR